MDILKFFALSHWYHHPLTLSQWKNLLVGSQNNYSLEAQVELLHEGETNWQKPKDKNFWEMLIEKVKNFERDQIRITYLGAQDYPRQFLNLERPPLVLHYKGQPIWENQIGVAVVGGRKISEQSLDWLESEFFKAIYKGADGVFTISGGARGVDQATHKVSLWAKRPTLAVVPSGINNLYPKSFQVMADEINEQNGCVMSPFSPEQEVRKTLFYYRNWCLVGMANWCVVIGAARRSGTYMSAKIGMDQGKDLLILPGHPMDALFGGSLDLLRSGAELLTDAKDLQMKFQIQCGNCRV